MPREDSELELRALLTLSVREQLAFKGNHLDDTRRLVAEWPSPIDEDVEKTLEGYRMKNLVLSAHENLVKALAPPAPP